MNVYFRNFRRFWSYQQKFFVTYLIIIVCAFSVSEFRTNVPILPIGYFTVIWVLALIFPLIAITYSLTRLRVRQNEIIFMTNRERLWRIYIHDAMAHDKSDEELDLDFRDYVQEKVQEYYGLWEYAGFSLLSGVIAFLFLLLIGRQFVIPDADAQWELLGPSWAVLVGFAFLGSYSGCLIQLLRRYRAFDLRPTTFLQVAIMLVAGTLAGAVVAVVYPQNELGILAFVIGFLCAINAAFLSQLMRTQFAKLTGTPLPELVPTNLHEIIGNSDAIEGLQKISVNSIKELSECDPMKVYLNIPQEISVILAWIDEAILRVNFAYVLDQLHPIGVYNFTQLLFRIDPEFSPATGTTWPPLAFVDIIDAGGSVDKNIYKSCKGILNAGTYHYVLGMRHYQYRGAFFG